MVANLNEALLLWSILPQNKEEIWAFTDRYYFCNDLIWLNSSQAKCFRHLWAQTSVSNEIKYATSEWRKQDVQYLDCFVSVRYINSNVIWIAMDISPNKAVVEMEMYNQEQIHRSLIITSDKTQSEKTSLVFCTGHRTKFTHFHRISLIDLSGQFVSCEMTLTNPPELLGWRLKRTFSETAHRSEYR